VPCKLLGMRGFLLAAANRKPRGVGGGQYSIGLARVLPRELALPAAGIV